MFANWQLMLLSFFYIALLFLIAYLGDKYRHLIQGKRQALIYAFAVSVYCTSWSFLGTTGQAATSVYSYLPIYLGPILLLVFAWPFLQRIIQTSISFNLTSIADLLAARFGKSHALAILVTMVSLLGTMPYIALQIKAIVYSFQQLQIQQDFMPWQLGLVTSFVLAGFSILFGIRNIDVTERHPGIMLAIAFEALVKIIAFASVGIFICYIVFDSPQDIWQQASANADLASALQFPDLSAMFGMIIIVMAAFFVLPRQFHVMIVELRDEQDAWLSRRIFPLYLLVFAFFSAPLGLAGYLLLGNSVPADMYVLVLPWYQDQMWLTLFAFLGAISAASSMVIVSTIALSTMLSNEIVFPFLFKKNKHPTQYHAFRLKLLNIRKVLVMFVIFLSYLVFLFIPPTALASLGATALGALAQLTPALIASFYWRRATLKGVFTGISLGFSLWTIFNFLPQLGLYQGPLEGTFFASSTAINLLCLTINIVAMILISLVTRSSIQERIQGALFLKRQLTPSLVESKRKAKSKRQAISIDELLLLTAQFVGDDKASKSFQAFEQVAITLGYSAKEKSEYALEHAEKVLSSVMGSSSARLVLNSALDGHDFALDELATLVGNASSHRQEFSQNLLKSAIENTRDGISIVNDELELVAWNKQYAMLFDYPDDILSVGCSVESLIRFNAERGLCGAGDTEFHVKKRLDFLRLRQSHNSERLREDGKVIRIEGNPLPDGGFLMVFSDITVFRQAEQVLKEANQDLETRVTERTNKLEKANKELAKARVVADEALSKKSHYLQVCSHDLLQPLEAARLFTSALASQSTLNEHQQRQVKSIDLSLKVANEMIVNLAEVARIESGSIKPHIETFALNDLFSQLANEFSAAAKQHGVSFTIMPTKHWVNTDKHLLRRILQNLIGNAFRYASPGRVLLGCRRKSGQISIQLLDNGPGIAAKNQAKVFEQFSQLEDNNGSNDGLGLGLSICNSLSVLLQHQLSLDSIEGRGCRFSLQLCEATALQQDNIVPILAPTDLTGTAVLCIDNNPAILEGMLELMSSWDCEVYGANSITTAKALFKQCDFDILLVDYQLDNGEDGLTLISALRAINPTTPAILITATTEAGIADKAAAANVGLLRKLVKPAALRAMMSAQLTESLQTQFSR
ncbi:PAS domain-containing hybrid sensor histidine kinase/response regulator [Moritella dasanensis]|uniref:PAS domain-containing hybrid sensor histidine kinase/response regulator n=1 Tax=Moritella dasanensis TaxID=428031 RepID=UPI000301B269|nr:PAS domain-containing hybrid sensor histidine kinase/response regulator [Moritella dasanensis]